MPNDNCFHCQSMKLLIIQCGRAYEIEKDLLCSSNIDLFCTQLICIKLSLSVYCKLQSNIVCLIRHF